jgi:hypothetical protein
MEQNNNDKMTEINDKITIRKFLYRIFIANSGVSSRRVLAVGSWIAMIFLMFFNYNIEYVRILLYLIIGLLSLTTISSYGKKPEDQEANKV